VHTELLTRPSLGPTPREFLHEGVTWTAREVDAELIPGSRGARCLILECQEAVRRLWVYPANWRQLDPELLWQAGERSPRAKALLQSLEPGIMNAISGSMATLATSQALLRRTGDALRANDAHRETLRELLQRCRTERDTMREAVESCARQLRGSGVTAPDALLIVANAIRVGNGSASANSAAVAQFDRDASRWCADVYRAA
jgi:hypothetical protein